MLLTLKNKMIVGMESLLKEAEKKGGIPKIIKLTKSEMHSLLMEISTFDSDMTTFRKLFTFDQKHLNTGNLKDLVFRFSTLEEGYVEQQHQRNTKIDVIFRWANGDYMIKYRDIPLKHAERKNTNEDLTQ